MSLDWPFDRQQNQAGDDQQPPNRAPEGRTGPTASIPSQNPVGAPSLEPGGMMGTPFSEGGGGELGWQPHSQLLYSEGVEAESVVARPHVDQSQLLCRTGCGFYGYPAWQGHCSKCYKDIQNRSAMRRSTKISRPVFDPTNIKNKVSRSVSDVSYLPGKASMLINRKIDKLDEKRRQQMNKHKNNNIVKSIFRKSSTLKAGRDAEWNATDTATATTASQELDAFLKTLSKEGGGAIRKQVSVFVDRLRRGVQSQSLEDTADQLQELYNTIHNMVTTHPAFAGLTADDVSRATILTERYVTTRLNTQLRAVVNARSEEQDLDTQNRIRSLSWISAELLECKLDDSVEAMAEEMDTIINELLQVDGIAVPSEKLRVLVSCSHRILQALSSLSEGAAPASADDFLPALILSVIRANPPMLHSNIAYITNFAPHAQLQSGEAGYYFTNLCCAVAFIEKVCGASLGLTEQEFARHMSGRALPRHPQPPPSVTALANCLQRCDRAADSLDAITASYRATMEEMLLLQTTVANKVADVLTQNPLVTRPPHSCSELLHLVEAGQEHLLLDLLTQGANFEAPVVDNPSSLPLPSPSKDAPPAPTLTVDRSTKPASKKLPAILPECEEAFNLYYSLEDFITADPLKSLKLSPPQRDASINQTFSDSSHYNNSSITGSSLLDDPVLDVTVPLLDHQQQSSSLQFDAEPASLSLLDEQVSPQSSTAALLPLPQYTGFRVQSNQIPSIPCDAGPTSLPSNLSPSTGPHQPPLFPARFVSADGQPSSLVLHREQCSAAGQLFADDTTLKWLDDKHSDVGRHKVMTGMSLSSSDQPGGGEMSGEPNVMGAPVSSSPLDRVGDGQGNFGLEREEVLQPCDAFASPEHKASLPPPLLPMVTPLTLPTTLSSTSCSVASTVTAAPTATSSSSYTPAVVSSTTKGVVSLPDLYSHHSPWSSHVTDQTPTRKDTLDKVVDVLAGIADSIDQLLAERFNKKC